MMAPWWVPWGPRSCGWRSWTRRAPARRGGVGQAPASRGGCPEAGMRWPRAVPGGAIRPRAGGRARAVAVAVAGGGLRVGALERAVPGRPGEGLHVGPVHGQCAGGVLVPGGDAGLQQVITDAGELPGRRAVGLLVAQRRGDQAVGVPALPG